MVTRCQPVGLVDAVVRRRGKTILGPVTLDLPAAGLTIVLGPNGAGKTTLLRAMHGLERLSEGRLLSPDPVEIARENQGFVFQTPIMLRRSVSANLAYPLRLTKTPTHVVESAVAKWAARINLAGALDRAAPSLSGGEKQKLALARALIREPALVFLDEPCANLDGRATREIEELLQDAVAKGTRIIMTTHDIGQARRLADDVVFILHGRLHEAGDANTFFAKPKTKEAAAFLKGDIVE